MHDTLGRRTQCHQETVIDASVTGMITDLCVLPPPVGHLEVCDQETGAVTGTKVATEVDHELHPVDTEVHPQGVTQMMSWVCLVGRRMRCLTYRFWFSMKGSLGMYPYRLIVAECER